MAGARTYKQKERAHRPLRSVSKPGLRLRIPWRDDAAPVLPTRRERLPEDTANMPVANAIRKARVQAAMTDEDDTRAEEEGTLAQHLSQVFCVMCSFCGKQMCSSAAIGQAADYNDRFEVAARFVAKGWGAMTKTKRSRKLRPACPNCVKRKSKSAVGRL